MTLNLRFMAFLLFSLLFQVEHRTGTTLHRRIEQYEKAGPFLLEKPKISKESRNKEALIRGWLWEHWKGHRLGYLVATRYSIEGERSTSTYYVEPDESGAWSINVEIVRALRDRKKPNLIHETTYSFSAPVVRRIEIRPNGLT